MVLSHKNIYEEIINKGYKKTLILEDDVEPADESLNLFSEIISELPDKVVISFDIDGLYSWYCPNTGTPVQGGFSFEQATYLFNKLANSGKQIIGIDLVEVAPGEHDHWDGNVGARMLFHLCGIFAKNNGLHVGERISF